jgi:hypothetical protein
MSGDALQWLALALMGAAMAGAAGAIIGRSLFASCMHLAASGVAVAGVVLLLGEARGALAVALFAAAWAPVLLLGAMLLSTRAAKHARSGSMLLGWVAAAIATALLWWPLGELTVRADTIAGTTGLGFWIAPVLLVLAIVCLGLLGYGERGAMANGDVR